MNTSTHTASQVHSLVAVALHHKRALASVGAVAVVADLETMIDAALRLVARGRLGAAHGFASDAVALGADAVEERVQGAASVGATFADLARV